MASSHTEIQQPSVSVSVRLPLLAEHETHASCTNATRLCCKLCIQKISDDQNKKVPVKLKSTMLHEILQHFL